ASGQTKIPSLAPTSRATPIISSSCGFGSRSRLRGQLKGWLQKRNINRPLGLCYFGMADPRYYAIAHDNLPGGYPFEAERSFDIGIWACFWALAESSPGDSTGYQWLEFSPYAVIILFFAAATAVRL